jgi:hypothetical protein
MNTVPYSEALEISIKCPIIAAYGSPVGETSFLAYLFSPEAASKGPGWKKL